MLGKKAGPDHRITEDLNIGITVWISFAVGNGFPADFLIKHRPQRLTLCVCVSVCLCVSVLIVQSCTTLCNPMDCSLPGSSVHGILQTRILEWVDMPFSRESSHPRDQNQVSCIAGRFFTI